MTDARLPKNPFPGLRPFDVQDVGQFFGREDQVKRLYQILEVQRFLAVVGTSGSGKSSLVRAGLLPVVKNERPAWHIAIFRPGNNPVGNLAAALNDCFFDAGASGLDTKGLFTEASLRRGSLGLTETIASFRISGNLLIVVDQFEELFEFRDQAEKSNSVEQLDAGNRFVKLLLESSRKQRQLPIHVAITMRSDFIGDCPRFRGLAEAVSDGQHLIPRLERHQIRAAIEKPITLSGADISTPLLNHILNEIGESRDYLPVMQHALMRTYQQWLEDPQRPEKIDRTHYDQTGGMHERPGNQQSDSPAVPNALSKHADEVYDDLGTKDAKLVAEFLFKALTLRDSKGRDIRRPQTIRQIAAVAEAGEEDVKSVINAFRKPGVNFLMPPPDKALTSETRIDISHESLMRRWTRLKDWIEEEAESAMYFRYLADRANRHYSRKERQPHEKRSFLQKLELPGLSSDSDFLSGSSLQEANDWEKKQRPTWPWAKRYPLGEQHNQQSDFKRNMQFLEASRRNQQISITYRWLTAAILWAALFATGIAITFFSQRNAARQAQYVAERARITADSLRFTEKIQRRRAEEAVAARDSALIREQNLRNRAEELAIAALFSAKQAKQSKKRALSSERKFLYLNEETDWIKRFPENMADAIVDSLTKMKYDSQTPLDSIAFYRLQESLRQASIGLQKAGLAPKREDDYGLLYNETFADSGAGFRIAQRAKNYDNNRFTRQALEYVRLSLPRTPALELQAHSELIWSAEFDQSGQRLLTASDDGTAILWSRSGDILTSLKGHAGGIRNAHFSPDEERIITASRDNTARIWDINGNELMVVSKHSGFVYEARFSPNGRYFLTASADSSVNIFNATGKSLKEIRVGTQVVAAIFSNDNELILSGGADGKIREYDLRGKLRREIAAHEEHIQSIWLSRDGSRILSTSSDRSVKLWTRSGGILAEIEVFDDIVWEAVFSIDGNSIFAASEDGSIKSFDFNGSLLLDFKNGGPAVNCVAQSPDGGYLLTGGADYLAKLWDLSSNRRKNIEINALSFKQIKQFGILQPTDIDPQRNEHLEIAIRYFLKREQKTKDHYLKRQNANHVQSFVNQLCSNLASSNAGDHRYASYFLLDSLRNARGTGYETSIARRLNKDPALSILSNESKILNALTTPRQRAQAFDLLDSLLRQGENRYFRGRRSLQLAQKAINTITDVNVQLHLAAKALELSDNFYTRQIIAERQDDLPVQISIRESNSSGINDARFSKDGQQVLTARTDGKATVRGTDGKLSSKFVGHETGVITAAFGHGPQSILTGDALGQIRLWNADGTLRDSIDSQSDGIFQLKLSPDKQSFAAATESGGLILFDLAGNELNTLKHSEEVFGLAYSPDGKILATGCWDDWVRLWDNEGNLLDSLSHPDDVNEVAFSPDGKQLLSGCDDSGVRLWAIDGELLWEDSPFDGFVISVDWSSDGNYFAAGSQDGNVCIWSQKRQLLATIDHQQAITRVVFSPDNSYLMTAGGDGIVRLYDIGLLRQHPKERLANLPELPYTQQIEYRLIEPETVLVQTDPANIYFGARYYANEGRTATQPYLKKISYKTALKIYQHLLNTAQNSTTIDLPPGTQKETDTLQQQLKEYDGSDNQLEDRIKKTLGSLDLIWKNVLGNVE